MSLIDNIMEESINKAKKPVPPIVVPPQNWTPEEIKKLQEDPKPVIVRSKPVQPVPVNPNPAGHDSSPTKPETTFPSPLHPLNVPEETPPTPDFILAGNGLNSLEAVYQHVQDNFKEYTAQYEQGFIAVHGQDALGRNLINWNYSPSVAESTLMAYYNNAETSTKEGYRQKVDQIIEDHAEDRDKSLLKRFAEVVDYDPDACRSIVELDPQFFSSINDIDIVDFNLRYHQLKQTYKTNALLIELIGHIRE